MVGVCYRGWIRGGIRLSWGWLSSWWSLCAIEACIVGSYHLGKRQERKPEAEQSTLYHAFKLWPMVIQGYVVIVGLIAGGLYFFLPHLFVPALAFPVVGGILLGAVILFVAAYFLARKAKASASVAVSTPWVKESRPDLCTVCNTKIGSEEKYCPNCGAAVE